MKKYLVSILIGIGALNAQGAALSTLTCESGNRNVETANCWNFGSISYTNSSSQKISGDWSMRSNQPTNLDPGACWIKTPWIKPTTGLISFKVKFESSTGATNRRIILCYAPYDASSASAYKEGSYVRFDSITYTPNLPTTSQTLTFALPAAIQNATTPYKIRISFVGTGGSTRYNIDDVVIPGQYWADPSNSCLPLPTIQDADTDGVADADDAYPNDATRAYNTFFPSTGKGTLMFEDLWPATGDFDFNDLVASYRIQYVTNASNKIVEVKLGLTVRAIGASMHNGFGLQFNSIAPSKVLSVTGTQTNGASWVSNAANGTENGQTYANILIFDDAFKVLPSPGGSGVNIDPTMPYVTPVEINVTVAFTTESGQAVSISDMDLNPYLIVNQERGKEIHLANQVPTSKANSAYFGTDQDDTNPGSQKYYKTKNNLPWAIAVEAEIPYTLSKVDLLEAYKKFAEWAQSGGNSYSDWYLDNSGYRDTSKLYSHP